MTQSDLADKLGIHRNTLASWLNGQRSANVEDVIAILDAMGYEPGEYLDMRLGDLIRVEE
jgi:transcriptional regulator with XRE-family HTH domain